MPDLVAYLLNLDRSPERLAAMRPQLERLGLPWKRVAAVDGAAMGPQPWPGYDRAAYQRNWGKLDWPQELGCYLSHVEALREFLADGGPVGLILEDDGVFADELGVAIDEALACREAWDVVKLAGIHRGMPATVRKLGGRRRLVAYLQRQTGSAAYLVNRKAAEAYVAALLPMRVPYDHEFDKAWRYGIRLRGIEPRPIEQVEGPSTISDGGAWKRKYPWYQRVSVFFYRSRTEIRRAVHYLLTDTEWMRWVRKGGY